MSNTVKPANKDHTEQRPPFKETPLTKFFLFGIVKYTSKQRPWLYGDGFWVHKELSFFTNAPKESKLFQTRPFISQINFRKIKVMGVWYAPKIWWPWDFTLPEDPKTTTAFSNGNSISLLVQFAYWQTCLKQAPLEEAEVVSWERWYQYVKTGGL